MKYFISYSYSVQDTVQPIIDQLRDNHGIVWWDQDLRVRQDPWACILDNIDACHVFILMVSEKAVKSPYCLAELRYARARNRLVLPYIMDSSVSYPLPSELHHMRSEPYIDDPEQFCQRLYSTCREISWPQYRDQYSVRPREPHADPDSCVEQLNTALRMTFKGDFKEAIYRFNAVLLQAYYEYRTFCNAWIAQIESYQHIAGLAAQPSTRPPAALKWMSFIQQYGEDFDPLGLRHTFLDDDTMVSTPIELSLLSDEAASSWSADETAPSNTLNLTEACDTTITASAVKPLVELDVYRVITEFTQTCDAQNWEQALNTLHELRSSGAPIPRVFNIEAYEKDIRSKLEAEERDKSYSLIQRMLRMKKPNAKRIREALEVFARRYPEYDPHQLRRLFPQG